MKATEETKALAKEAGIKSWHVKSEETLQEELAKLAETTNTGGSDEHIDSVDSNSDSGSSNISDTEVDQEVTLPTDTTPKLMLWSIKAVGKKSKYWKYKHLLG